MSTENVASTVLLGMGKGSGIDIVKLARDLTDVEKAPREAKLNDSIEESEAKISGLAVLKYNVQLLIDQFNSLNDASELATPTATSSDAAKVSVSATDGSALTGISDISVTSLAAAQRNKSNQYLGDPVSQFRKRFHFDCHTGHRQCGKCKCGGGERHAARNC